MRIVLDAMGGDHAPDVPVAGAVSALDRSDSSFEIVLIGDEVRIREALARHRYPEHRLTVRHAPDVIAMDESPAAALRHKKASSIMMGIAMQKAGDADAFVSAGNTGAVMAAALTTLGRIASISRPAIMTIFPTRGEPCVVADVGANVNSKPMHLLQFAVMASMYARDVLGRPRPRVGLLSIGEESTKGNELTIAAHRLLAESDLHFIGNVEGGHVLKGAADVVVCDGFVGNVMLKFGESFVDFLSEEVRELARRSPLAAVGAVLMRGAFRSLRRQIDYTEYGGAPLLGVNGIVIISHGGSNAKAFRNAVGVARRAVEGRLNRHIEEAVRASVADDETTP